MNEEEMYDPFEEALGLPKRTEIVTHTIEPFEIEPEQNVEIKTFVQNDYEFSRQSMRELIVNGTQIFKNCTELAQQTQQADTYTVAIEMMKTLVAANEKLVKLSESHAKVTDNKKREIQREKEETEKGPTTVNNNLIVTTAELHRMIEDARNGSKTEE